eukprot:3602934-Rhodomonas_salina.1
MSTPKTTYATPPRLLLRSCTSSSSCGSSACRRATQRAQAFAVIHSSKNGSAQPAPPSLSAASCSSILSSLHVVGPSK